MGSHLPRGPIVPVSAWRDTMQPLSTSPLSTPLSEKYVLERRLGGGGMAEVFLARTVGAEGFSRPIAIKRVLAGYSDNPMFARMFIEEARICARLGHPNIVSVIDFDRDAEGRLFLAMELVDGIDLDGLMQTGMLPFDAIIYVLIEMLRGLGHAHELPISDTGMRGVVHRDVSPHNVLLSWEGAVKVSDFGIAKAREASNATATMMVKGKPAYMSPEQANGEALDGRSDLFAVGIMLWEMLCGRPLFAGDTTQETLARVLFAPIPSPRALRPDVPLDLAAVTERLLARDRASRFSNADAAISALVGCVAHPRNGRETMIQLLAERCHGRAPVRPRSGVSAAPTAPTRVLGGAMSQPVLGRLPGPLDGTHAASIARSAQPSATRARLRWILIPLLLLGLGVAGYVASQRESDLEHAPTRATATVPVSLPLTPLEGAGASPPGSPDANTAPPPTDADQPRDAAVAVPADAAAPPDDAAGSTRPRPTIRPTRPGKPPGSPTGITEVHLGG